MLNLLFRFCLRRSSITILILSVVLWLTPPVRATKQACNSSPIFAYSQALYWRQYDRAQQLLPRIRGERSVEMADFLAQVLVWKQAYDAQDNLGQNRALRVIDSQIKSIQKKLKTGQGTALTAGNIMIHAARLNLLKGRLLHATRLAKRGKQLLAQGMPNHSNEANAYLTSGLYEVYTAKQESGFLWLKRLFSLQGNDARGRELIEKAMSQSADFAFEAARSLKMELDWNKHEICGYPDLSVGLGSPDIETLAILQQEIAVDLFCGRTQRVTTRLQLIAAHHAQTKLKLSDDQQQWLNDANLYRLAQSGDVEALTRMVAQARAQGDQAAELRARFSWAKAMDVKGDRKGATMRYQRLLKSKLESNYKVLARQYLITPYRSPVVFEIDQKQDRAMTMLACSG